MKKIYTVLLLIACAFLTSCWGCQLSRMQIELNEYSVELSVGDEFLLKADVSYDFVDYKGLEWKSNDEKVATVSQTGLVTAVGNGITEIIATAIDYGESASCIVKVNDVPTTGMTLNKEKLELSFGEEFLLVPSFLPENSAGGDVVWESSDSSVADVDENGVVVGLGEGTATITASINNGNIKASCEVTVKEADGPLIYSLGEVRTGKEYFIKVWKNGRELYVIEENLVGSMDATSLFVDGNDVYVGGWISNDGTYNARIWKNGEVLYSLRGESDNAYVRNVFVYNGDVYASGVVGEMNKQIVTVWKNGQELYRLTQGENWASANDLYISAGEVYVAGLELIDGTIVTKLWKNRELLFKKSKNSHNNPTLFVDGEDFYLGATAEYQLPVAKVWKNGTELYSISNVDSGSVINSLYVYGGDVYAAGHDGLNEGIKAVIWKNGEVIYNFSDGAADSDVADVTVFNGDVYSAGYRKSNDAEEALVWKNDKVLYELNKGYESGAVTAIFVK